MTKEQTDYGRVLEDVRHIYKQKYNVVMDDELLYIIIRLNEMQVAVNKKIDAVPKVSFGSGKDYFFYALGKTLSLLVLGVGLILVGSFLFIYRDNASQRTYELLQDGKGTSIKLNGYNGAGDTVLHVYSVNQGVYLRGDKNKR